MWKKHVIGRFKFFESSTKDRKKRIQLIADELKVLWNQTLNFPQLSNQAAIRAKLEKLLKNYELCRKKQIFDPLNELFDVHVTKVKGEWLCREDKNFYLPTAD